MENRPCCFIFQDCAYPTHDKVKIRHIAWLPSFLFKIQCFYQDENDLSPDDQYYIKGKRNTLCFWRTITIAAIDVLVVLSGCPKQSLTESQVLYSFFEQV